MIKVADYLYADSELHVCIYADLLKLSATCQRDIDIVDAFYYLLDIGFTVKEACLTDNRDIRVIDLAIKAMKFTRIKNCRMEDVNG